MEGKVIKHDSGATSSELNEDWNDLPFAGLVAAARRFYFGRQKHGRFKWKRGNSEFAEMRLSHALRHAALFAETRKQEDLDALLCNFMMVAWYRMYKGYLIEERNSIQHSEKK